MHRTINKILLYSAFCALYTLNFAKIQCMDNPTNKMHAVSQKNITYDFKKEIREIKNDIYNLDKKIDERRKRSCLQHTKDCCIILGVTTCITMALFTFVLTIMIIKAIKSAGDSIASIDINGIF